jgi:hypothetical protein
VWAGQAAVADDRVGSYSQEPGGRPHAAPLIEMLEERDGFVLGQFRAEQGRPSPLGETVATSAAIEQTMLPLLAVPATNRQVADPALAVIGAFLALAAEAGEVVIHGGSSVTLRQRKEWIRAISLL